MPRKKGVSLKRSCPKRSEPDAMDVLNEGNINLANDTQGLSDLTYTGRDSEEREEETKAGPSSAAVADESDDDAGDTESAGEVKEDKERERVENNLLRPSK
ncbi:hypothetical protein QQF64_034071 [Cirrhinus molitorella]|uniref:Uncharacterized protein n=1 Tax=Cirrhinus molitorella TaxID=172907 RepID=A0ABR3MVP4_9TELE